jgi:hypothetical protein
MIVRMLAFALALTFGIGPVVAEESMVKSPIIHVQLSFNKTIKPPSLVIKADCSGEKSCCCKKQNTDTLSCQTPDYCKRNEGECKSSGC